MADASQKRHPIPVRLNLLIVGTQLILLFAIFWGTSLASTWWHLSLLAIAMAIVGNSVYSIIHEAEHRILHPNARVNDSLGVIMALFFPAPYHLLRQGHLCHHRFNRTDSEAFDLYFDGDIPWVKWVKFYSIITGVYWVTVVLANFAVLTVPFLLKRRFYEFDRHLAEFMDQLDQRAWPLVRLEALLAILLHAGIIHFLAIPPLHYAVVYFGFGYSWSAMQYVHHHGTERHVLRGTRNLRLFKWIDLAWLNHNWHLEHHKQPTIPWRYLPSLGKETERKPDFLLWHYLRMWRGPRYTKERMRGHFAGKVTKSS